MNFKKIVSAVNHTFRQMTEDRAAESAAGMAFYSFFSLFPLLLILVSFGGSFLESSQAQTQVLEFLLRIFPFSGDVIEGNIQEVLRVRSSVNALSTIMLLWSGSGAFAAFTRSINRAWPRAKRRPFVIRRLMALGAVIVLVVGLSLLLPLITLTHLLPSNLNDAFHALAQMRFISQILVWVLFFLTSTMLYRWIPNIEVTSDEAIWGGLTASIGSAAATGGFTWFLKSGLVSYNLVYGSLGAIVALMAWIYLLSIIILFGAYLSAAIAEQKIEMGD
ncbi:MAG: YihY/virulence factor BrkB family protein [Chloroflexi bacterium]|nr:YihY/virulence factor BrkB family protein [Chloroflexota bacterium]